MLATFTRWLGATAALLCMSAAGAETITLSSLEQTLRTAPASQAAAAREDARRANWQAEQARSGWRVELGADANYQREVVDRDRTRNYAGSNAYARLTRPLLGTSERQHRSTIEARGDYRAARLQSRVERAETRARLAAAYVDYLVIDHRRRLADAYLDHAIALEARLGQRHRADRLAASDLHRLTGTVTEARTVTDNAGTRQRHARARLETVVGRSLPAFAPTWPGLHQRCTDNELPSPASVRAAATELTAARERAAHTDFAGVDANVSLGYSPVFEEGGDRGYQWFAGVSVSVPLALPDYRGAVRQRLRAEARQARHELAATRARQRERRLRLMSALDNAAVDARQARARLEIARTLLRESERRRRTLTDIDAAVPLHAYNEWWRASDTLVAARAAYWRIALDMASRDQLTCELLANAPKAPAMSPVTANQGESLPPKGPPMGFYHWRGERFLNRAPAVWNELEKTGARRVLVSFRGETLRDLVTDPAPLRRVIEAAHARDLSIQWLLGDPHWALDEHRGDLVNWLSALGHLGWDGIHLDIEIDHLPDAEARRPALLAGYLETLKRAADVSPVPIGVSIHPRYIERDFGYTCLPCRIAATGIDGIAVMDYRRPRSGVAERFAAMVERIPDLSVTLAVSVEPHLHPDASWRADDPATTRANLTRLARRLDDRIGPRFGGILIQDWSNWQSQQR